MALETLIDPGRRLFLKVCAALAAVGAIPGALRAFFVKELEVRTVEKENFRFDAATGMIAWKGKGKEPYSLIVDGLVDRSARLSYRELQALPQVSQSSAFHCVEGWSVKDVRWGGFRFEELTKRVKPRPEARFVIFHALGNTTSRPGGLDHYRECLPLSELLDPARKALLALTMNGKPLPHDHGAPLRSVVPLQLGYKGAKFVARIEFARESVPGWWTLANPIYPTDAPVPPERLGKG